jgi:tellurium resistance protein TerD
MAIILKKGDRMNIGLTKMSVGLGWKPNEGTGDDFDLDASAFMLGKNNKIPAPDYVVCYGNLNSPDGALLHTGDDRTGGNSEDGDDEIIEIDLSKIDSKIENILFVVTIDEFKARKQNFGQVRDSYIRIVDNSSNNEVEVAKYELGEDFSMETAIEFGRLYKRNGQWRFEASGIGFKESIDYFFDKYVKGIDAYKKTDGTIITKDGKEYSTSHPNYNVIHSQIFK